MCRVEAEEEHVSREQPDKPIFHLCIINLVIGTLYSSKGNYEFGISRILKSLEPLDRKLGADTWYYAKRCFLSLAEALAKHMVVMRDGVLDDIISFLDDAAASGGSILTVIHQGVTASGEGRGEVGPDGVPTQVGTGSRTVAFEARGLKKLYMHLRDEH